MGSKSVRFLDTFVRFDVVSLCARASNVSICLQLSFFVCQERMHGMLKDQLTSCQNELQSTKEELAEAQKDRQKLRTKASALQPELNRPAVGKQRILCVHSGTFVVAMSHAHASFSWLLGLVSACQ